MAESAQFSRERWTRARRLATVWMIAAACLFLWWAAHYTSFIEDLGEWQFDRIGAYRPTLTTAALVLIVAIPVGIVLFHRSRRKAKAQREQPEGEGLDPAQSALGRARTGTTRSLMFTGAVAIAAAGLAVAVALSTIYLPSGDGMPTAIRAGATLIEGPAHLEGRYRVGRVARLNESVILVGRETYVAPVLLAGDPGSAARVVTTVLLRPEGGFSPITSGVLVRRGTPRELRNLYANVNVPIVEDSYMLMRNEAQVTWRSWALAAHLAIVALVAALAWLLSRRRDRRLAKVEAIAPTR